MQNIETRIEGDKLHIIVDVSKQKRDAAPASKSGKTKVVATTSGFTAQGPVKVSLNVIC